MIHLELSHDLSVLDHHHLLFLTSHADVGFTFCWRRNPKVMIFHTSKGGSRLEKHGPQIQRFNIRNSADGHIILGCPPAQDASHHQDYYIFRLGDPNLKLHLPLLLGGGTTQAIFQHFDFDSFMETCYTSFKGSIWHWKTSSPFGNLGIHDAAHNLWLRNKGAPQPPELTEENPVNIGSLCSHRYSQRGCVTKMTSWEGLSSKFRRWVPTRPSLFVPFLRGELVFWKCQKKKIVHHYQHNQKNNNHNKQQQPTTTNNKQQQTTNNQQQTTNNQQPTTSTATATTTTPPPKVPFTWQIGP